MACQAGIQLGHRILDAGCGVCGPSIDIAQNTEGTRFEAITLSSAQAETARKLVQQAGLADRIKVYVGDFHHLPFDGGTFDVAILFESAGYSYDCLQLFSEVYRVLRPAGKVYVKDVFSKEGTLSDQERQELKEFDRVYARYTSYPMSEMLQALSACGFEDLASRDVSEMISAQKVADAMFEYKSGREVQTDFGKLHFRQFQCLPTLFGEIKARKPVF